MDFTSLSTPAVLEEIGARMQRERLNQNVSQAVLAARAGIAERALQNLEHGQGSSLETLMSVIRALGKLEQLNALLPEPGPSPLQLARMEGRVRQRASRPRSSSGSGV
ncbi:MAG: hypothetical protein A2X67_03555 [Ignavibacteria bacterium GWA2_55_11]|nr:MAG: hypothetical protein A2X67_03555 [Ignavibacteria bacterium GWA2_55_11]OGU75362.1 MAG: hypothetical protein A3H45_08855 [Ignavibacteria bacterium RIFCSPLOWO2_02_FULL_55_14]OGU75999.1 MAG: hypothetical protein A3G43_11635 [Ignavibacteria bacterium RIFCSPLOWO2_12_FULL_56_21]HAV23595.1 XRE family transcriptional regulator [Bacteroidota bacterium]